MGLRKHGTGEAIVRDDEDLTKTASTPWTNDDETALIDENQE